MRRIPLALLVTTLLILPVAADGHHGLGVSAGGGRYTVVAGDGSLAEMTFAYGAFNRNAASTDARGSLYHVGTFQGHKIEFFGTVTCLAVDSLNHRAWIGGVIVRNGSTHPTYRDSIWAQPGHDIWFRVLDADGAGLGEPDRTTFVGFEGFIPTSEAYCRDRIWPDGNARTWAVTGNVIVKP